MPAVTSANDVKDPKLSRWIIKLPQSGLPITRLACVAPTPLFDRSLSLYEELTDERGDSRIMPFTTGRSGLNPITGITSRSEFCAGARKFSPRATPCFWKPKTATIRLSNWKSSRWHIRSPGSCSKPDRTTNCFFTLVIRGCRRRVMILSLVANQLLAADKKLAALGAAEQLQKSSWYENRAAGQGRYDLLGHPGGGRKVVLLRDYFTAVAPIAAAATS